jgi:hypothetical protein
MVIRITDLRAREPPMPIYENEVLMLALGIGVCLFGIASRRRLARVPGWPLLAVSYAVMLVAWIATVLEGFWLATPLNIVEHVGYALGAVLLAAWCWRASSHHRRGEAP